MKLLIVALCLATGPNLFIHCQVEVGAGAEAGAGVAVGAEVGAAVGPEVGAEVGAEVGVGDDAMMKHLAGVNINPEETFDAEAMLGLGKSNNTDFVDFADLDFGGRALRANDDDETLKFGDKGQFIAGKNDVLGEGAFGKVYKAMDTTTGREVAVKTELRQFGSPTLPTEARNYERIGPFRGIPKIYFAGKSMDQQSNVLVMQLLGKSLRDLEKERKNKKFSPKTVYMIGIQLMYRIEYVHKKRLVHRDIKPANMGIGNSGQLIYVFDFGLSKKFVDSEGKHLKEGSRSGFGSGTPRYMSAYAHSHITQSRRDDMESIGFMLMSFLRGDLPWDNAPGYGEPAHKSKVVQIKETLKFEDFCRGFAKQMVEYFKYVRNDLEFSTKPNYPYLRKLFRAALSDMGEKEDYAFDWSKK